MRKNILMGALAAILAVGLTGCTQEAREKYDSAGESMGSAAKKTGDAAATDAAKTGQAIEQGAENAAEAAKNATKEVGEEADDAQTTLAVKNAILTADNLDASNLNVDTEEHIVHLKGSVKSASEKARAESLAKGIVGSKYTVKNELTIGK